MENLEVLVRSQNLMSGFSEPGGQNSLFGSRTVIQGDRAFVSAPEVNNHGAVYVLELGENGDWLKQGFIEPADGFVNNRFGADISVHGNTVAITSSGHVFDDESICMGAVYLYTQKHDSWEFQQKINSPAVCGELNRDQGFARSVYLTDNQLFIGQVTDNDVSEASGAVLVYNKTESGWTYTTKVKANEPKPGGIFGISIGVSSDWMLIGAKALDGTIGGGNGSAYFFHLENGEWVQKQRVSGNENNSGPDLYGQDVHISATRAFIGVPADDVGMRRFSGSVRIFELNSDTWEEVDILTAEIPNSGGFDYFGGSLDVLGDHVLVGSIDNGEIQGFAGAAYLHLYTDEGLQETQQYTANDSTGPFDDFASDVALHSNYVMVGKPIDNDEGFAAGSIYSFEREVEQKIPQKLTFDGVAFDAFGSAIEISGNMAFVGAAGSDENEKINSGIVYVFEYDGLRWNKHSELFPDEPQFAEAFGSSISISGDTAVIGAPVQTLIGVMDSDPMLGSVYVFEYDGNLWSQVGKIRPAVNDPQIHFGSQVNLDGDRLIVGAAKNGLEIGFFENNSSAFYFERINNTWEQKQHILSPNSQDEILFGSHLELKGDELLLSAQYDDTVFNLGGALYVYKFINDSWVLNYRITPDNHQQQSFFGASFTQYENSLLVSSPNSSEVHFFEKTNGTWVQTQNISDNDQYYSQNALINENHAYISCLRMNITRICVYENIDGVWHERTESELTLPESMEGLVDLTMKTFNNQLLVGTPSDDTEGSDAGIVFGYKLVDDLIFIDSFE